VQVGTIRESVRARQARLLIAPTARAMAWAPMMIASGIALAVVGNDLRRTTDPFLATMSLRNAALALAAGAAFVLDDPAAPTIESVPPSAMFRRAVRVGLLVCSVAPVWAALVIASAMRAPGVPVAALTLETAATVSFVVTVAAVMIKSGRLVVGALVVPMVLVFRMAGERLPDRWTLFGGFPGSDLWIEAHQHWVWFLALSLVTLAASTLDPARRRRLRVRVNRSGMDARQGRG
jgi:hypothetical protein